MHCGHAAFALHAHWPPAPVQHHIPKPLHVATHAGLHWHGYCGLRSWCAVGGGTGTGLLFALTAYDACASQRCAVGRAPLPMRRRRSVCVCVAAQRVSGGTAR